MVLGIDAIELIELKTFGSRFYQNKIAELLEYERHRLCA